MKKLILLILLSFLFMGNVFAIDIEMDAPSAILIDQNTGTVLYKKNEHEKRAMASMTKIMSLILIMEKIDDGSLKYDDEVEISAEASSMGGSQIFLQVGDKYKIKELIKSIAMASANELAVSIKQSLLSKEEIII